MLDEPSRGCVPGCEVNGGGVAGSPSIEGSTVSLHTRFMGADKLRLKENDVQLPTGAARTYGQRQIIPTYLSATLDDPGVGNQAQPQAQSSLIPLSQ